MGLGKTLSSLVVPERVKLQRAEQLRVEQEAKEKEQAEERRTRSQACQVEIQEVLERHHCTLTATMMCTPVQNIPSVHVQALALPEEVNA